MYSVKGKKPADLSRRQKGDPHVPHTTHFKRRDDLENVIPEPAKKVIADRLAQMHLPAQYDAETMMLEIYRVTRDACAAAGWPDSMAYQMRDYILGKVNDMKLRTFQGGDFRNFKIGEAYTRPARYVDKTGKQRNVDWIVRGKKPVAPSEETATPPTAQAESRALVSKGQQLAAFLLEADLHSDSEKQALQQPGPQNRPDVQHVLKRAEKWVANKQKKGWTQKRFAHGLKRFLQRERPRPGS